MRGKPILALVFVAIIGVALSIPLRDSADRRSASTSAASETPSPKKAETPTEEPTPSAEPSETEPPEDEPQDEPSDQARLSGSFPNKCLTPTPAPEGAGLLAIDQENEIEISDTSGGAQANVEDKFPFKWSPTGKYLMAGSGTVYDSRGEKVASLFESGSYSWAWSPIADCVVYASQEGGVSVFAPGSKGPTTLHDGLISRFSFSPSGGDLAYIEDDTENQESHLWVTSLATGKARRLTSFQLSSGEEVVLAGWTPDARHVLFWRGGGEALLRSGSSLFAASATGEVKSLARVVAHRDFLTSCGNNLLAIVGGGARIEANSKRLATLQVGKVAEYLTPPGAHDVSPSCSPDGDLVAVARGPQANGRGGAHHLTVLDLNGSVRFASSDTTSEDAYPLWGRGDAGILFIRRPVGGVGDPELWRISQTSAAQPTGAELRSVRRKPGIFRDSWGHWLDWSADQPSGVSVQSGPGS